MHTLDEIYTKLETIESSLGSSSCTGAPVEKTGQTKCYNASGTEITCSGTGQDGEYQKGIAWPVPRFTDNGNGTVTDNLTGLIWLLDANRFGGKSWDDALSVCNTLAADGTNLTDGSSAGDWRLPNVREIFTLIDFGQSWPCLSLGHPFTNVQFQSDYYWSSSTNGDDPVFAWIVHMAEGIVINRSKSADGRYVWPVRAGN